MAAAYLIARTRFPAPRSRLASFIAGCALLLAVQIGPARHARAALPADDAPAPERRPRRVGAAPLRARPDAAAWRRHSSGSRVRAPDPPARRAPDLARHLLRLAPALGVRRRPAPPVDDPPRRARLLLRRRLPASGGPSSTAGCAAARRRSTCSARSCSRARSACCSRCCRRRSTASTSDVPRLWGLSPLADQQIGGVTMAAEQAVVLFAVFALYVRRFLEEEEASDAFRTPTVPRRAKAQSARRSEASSSRCALAARCGRPPARAVARPSRPSG